MDKVDEGKQVKMQRVFLPKKKRRVLNRSKKKGKTRTGCVRMSGNHIFRQSVFDGHFGQSGIYGQFAVAVFCRGVPGSK